MRKLEFCLSCANLQHDICGMLSIPSTHPCLFHKKLVSCDNVFSFYLFLQGRGEYTRNVSVRKNSMFASLWVMICTFLFIDLCMECRFRRLVFHSVWVHAFLRLRLLFHQCNERPNGPNLFSPARSWSLTPWVVTTTKHPVYSSTISFWDDACLFEASSSDAWCMSFCWCL